MNEEYLKKIKEEKVFYNSKKCTIEEISKELKEQYKYGDKKALNDEVQSFFLKECANFFNDYNLEKYRNQMVATCVANKYMSYLKILQDKYANDSSYKGFLKENIPIKKGFKITSKEEYYYLRVYLEETYGGFSSDNLIKETVYTTSSLMMGIYMMIIEFEGQVLRECLKKWDVIIKKNIQGEDSFVEKKQYILCRKKDEKSNNAYSALVKEIKQIIGKVLGAYKDIVRNTIKGAVAEISNNLADYLCASTYTDEEVWKMFYGKKSIEILFKERLLNDLLYKRGDIVKELEKLNIIWLSVPLQDKEDIIKYNLRRLSGEKVLKELNEKYLRTYLVSSVLTDTFQKVYKDPRNIRHWVNSVFDLEKPYITKNLSYSLMKEALYIIMENEKTIAKKYRIKIEFSKNEEYIIKDDADIVLDYIWGVNENETSTTLVKSGLKTKFSPAFQIKKESNIDYRNLIEKGDCKNKRFASLLKNSFDLQQGLPVFEQYMLEQQTGILCAWKLYECTQGIISCSEKNGLQTSIEHLANQIGSIHNLEMRCWVLNEVSQIISALMHIYSCDVLNELEYIGMRIGEYARKVNEISDPLLKIFLTLYQERGYECLHYFKDISEDNYEKLSKELLMLWEQKNYPERSRYQIKINPIIEHIFSELYYSDAKTERYHLYQRIREEMKQGQKWVQSN